jgi:Domain of unknown function (DUF4226)
VAPKHFDQLTHWNSWDEARNRGIEGWSEPGWALPNDNTRYISRDDQYWNRVLDDARATYGDRNIHFNTDNHSEDRYLVFGDNTRLPADGTVIYHNPATHQNWIQNDDGTVSLEGSTQPPMAPVGYRPADGGTFAPIDLQGQQIGPLGGVPASPNGYYEDPTTRIQTPKNANGDYYSIDPNGIRHFFDKTGKPINQEQYDHPAPGQHAPGLLTSEQQSGRAADAVKKLQDELKNRYTDISDAEEKLSEVLLNAHATTTDGQQKLNDIQQKIEQAVDDPALSLDAPAGEQAFLKFLRSQVAAIGDVLQSGALSADDQAKAVAALGNLYTTGDADQPAAPLPEDPGLEPVDPMPDPVLPDAGLAGMATPVSPLASTLPAALGAIPPGGGLGYSPLDSLDGWAGAAGPLAGLASQLGDQARGDQKPGDSGGSGDGDRKSADDHRPDTADTKDKAPQDKPEDTGQPAPAPQPEPVGGTGQAVPPTAPAPTTSVQLPDGSTANARTAALAQAVKAYLGGTPVDEAYRQAGIDLPPPGTPVTNPIDPARLSCGYLGMFKDHYVVALSPVKALQDGQVVPLASVASGADFLGWIDPSTSAPAPAGSSG